MSQQSIQFAVYDQVAQTLGGATQGAHRCRFRNFDYGELPADNVLPESCDPHYDNNADVERTFRFRVRHVAATKDDAGSPVDGADRAADARYVRAQQLLMADRSLGGLVRPGSLREISQHYEFEPGSLELMALVVLYEVEFSTKINDPSQAGF